MTTSAPVLVTGATGFVASQAIALLLQRGYRVRGTVRSAGKSRDLAQLLEPEGATGRLEFVEADLGTPGSFDPAVEGCEYVMHTASPYVLTVQDPQRDLVDPAVNGTRNVLKACAQAGVRRVIVTSSMAAVTDEPASHHVLTEADWNVKSRLQRNPYYYSKTQAERAAWEFAENQKPPFEVITINPFLIIGPSLVPSLNTSNQIFADLLKGIYPGIMSLTWGMVDVRDVAQAHVLAMETRAAQGRYLCASGNISMREVVALLRENGYGAGYRLPAMSLDHGIGNILVRLSSYLQPAGVGSYLRTHVGRVPQYDTHKIRTGLGLSFRPVRESILDTMKDLARWGHLPRQRKS
jgi:dihydroflavonol-4-reductase